MGCQRDGAFQEYITMPIERVYDGKGMDAKTLAAIEPFCISYHGVSRANVKEGDKVLVVGAGTIGVLAAIAAKAKGAAVYISDVSAGKLEMAKDFGVDGTLLNDSPETALTLPSRRWGFRPPSRTALTPAALAAVWCSLELERRTWTSTSR